MTVRVDTQAAEGRAVAYTLRELMNQPEMADTVDALAARLEAAETALREEIGRVCECGGEDCGDGIGVGVIDSERSSFDHGANAYDGAGNVITDYFDCPCVPLRAVLDAGRGERG